MALGTGLEEFSKKYPERFFDVGIAEEHAVTFASGLSSGGMLPVFAVYSTFLQRSADQLIHDCALQRKKTVIAVDRAGFTGEDGETHQGLFDVSLVRSIPNTTVYSPATYSELSKALYNAFYKDSNLIIVRYPRGSMPDDDSFAKTNGDDFEVIGNPDAKIALVTYGRLCFNAYNAVKILSEENIDVKIIKVNKIKPLPCGAVESALNCSNVFFFEEGMRCGGVAEGYASMLYENGFKGKYKITAVDGEFVSHASVDRLLEKYSMSAEKMACIIKNGVTE